MFVGILCAFRFYKAALFLRFRHCAVGHFSPDQFAFSWLLPFHFMDTSPLRSLAPKGARAGLWPGTGSSIKPNWSGLAAHDGHRSEPYYCSPGQVSPCPGQFYTKCLRSVPTHTVPSRTTVTDPFRTDRRSPQRDSPRKRVGPKRPDRSDDHTWTVARDCLLSVAPAPPPQGTAGYGQRKRCPQPLGLDPWPPPGAPEDTSRMCDLISSSYSLCLTVRTVLTAVGNTTGTLSESEESAYTRLATVPATFPT